MPDRLHRGFREAGRRNAMGVVCLHGVGSGSASWLAQRDSFGVHDHAISWDAPGYGDSDALTLVTPRAALCD